jgi:hypothetical protein
VIRNSDLDITTGVPGSTFPSFGGVPVSVDDVLIKYTYTGDGNLDGAVTFDDYAAMDSAFFGLINNIGWATGDINFDEAITFDDYSVVDQVFFFQGAPLAASGEPEALAPGGAVVLGESQHSLTDALGPETLELRPALQLAAVPTPIASSDSDGEIAADLAWQSADSLADARLAPSRRSLSRDLWDTALLSVAGE